MTNDIEKINKIRQCISLLESVADTLEYLDDLTNMEHLDFIIEDLRFNLLAEEERAQYYD